MRRTPLQKITAGGARVAMCAVLLCGLLYAAENRPGNKGVIMRKGTPVESPPPKAPPPVLPPTPREERRPTPTAEPPTPPPASVPRSNISQPPRAPAMPPAAIPAAWPAALNEYFHCSLQDPAPDDVLRALVAHLNRVTLLGGEPEAERGRFDAWLKQFKRSAPKGEPGAQLAEGFYENLTGWVELESQFTIKPERNILKRLVKIVESQAALDPAYDDARKQRIVETIEQQGLFVPSGILFGYSVLPYRAVLLPNGYIPFESPVKPEFTDTANQAEATYDFIEAPGPIYRIDFDTVNAARVVVERSHDGKQFDAVQEWKSAEPAGIRPPVILAKPFRERYLRVRVGSPKETAVLRNPRVFALKEPPAAISTLEIEAPVLDGSFKEAPWPRKAQIDGFVNPATVQFAEAQTTIRVCHTTESLYIAVYAREPRMSTMECTLTARDAPLWEEESLAIVIQPKGKPEFRFVVNPLAAQFDSRDGDDDWNGEWKVATDSWPVGWSAEVEIPFSSFGAAPGKDDWKLNFVRTRRNVENEQSVWVYSPDKTQKEAGLLIF